MLTSKRSISICAAALCLAGCSALRAQETGVELTVNDPRPVAEAVSALEVRYGQAITYEDPRYVHDADVADVTYQVRRDLAAHPIGRAPKVLIPRGGRLEARYSAGAGTAEAIQKVLDASASAGGPAFSLSESGGVFHVTPALAKNRSGIAERQMSILNIAITLPDEDRDGVEMLEAICKAVGDVTGTEVSLGTAPYRLFARMRRAQGVFNTTARDALKQLLESTGVKLSWRLLYDPGDGDYALNIHPVSSDLAGGAGK